MHRAGVDWYSNHHRGHTYSRCFGRIRGNRRLQISLSIDWFGVSDTGLPDGDSRPSVVDYHLRLVSCRIKLEIMLHVARIKLSLVHAFDWLTLIVAEHGIFNRDWYAERVFRVIVNNWALPVVNGILLRLIILGASGSPITVSWLNAAKVGTLPVLVCRCLNVKPGVWWVHFQVTDGWVLNYVVFRIYKLVKRACKCKLEGNGLAFGDVSV